jgi:hypothetical protein
MVEVLKLMHKEVPMHLHNMFSARESCYSSHNHSRLEQPKYKTVKYGYNSFRYQGAKLWNLLDNDFKQGCTLVEFKRLLYT